MTTAVCFRCGAIKFGAILPCGSCGAKPGTEDELIRSVWMSDHHFSRAKLESIAAAVAAGQPPILDDETKARLVEGLRGAEAAAPSLSAALGFGSPRGDAVGKPPRRPTLEEVRRIKELQSPALEGITPEEWEEAAGDPEAMTQLLIAKNREIKGEASKAAGASGHGGVRRCRGWWAFSLVLGTAAGIGGAYLVEPYSVWARSSYSGQRHLMFFDAQPSEAEIVASVIYEDPGYYPKGWPDVLSGGKDRLYIKLDDSTSVLVAPYSPADDPNPRLDVVEQQAKVDRDYPGSVPVYPEPSSGRGVWLTEPATRTEFPPLIVRTVSFVLCFASAVLAVLAARLLWYFLLARTRELSRAVRGT